MRTGTIHSLAAAAVLLAACGGGGDDGKTPAVTVAYGGPTGSATISDAAIGTIATAATSATQGLSGMSGGYTGFVGASRAPAAGVKQAMELIAGARRGGTSLAGAIYSDGGPCDGGGAGSVRMSDADDDPYTTSNGDWIEMSFDRCTDAYGDMLDGSFRLTILETGGGDPFDPASVVGTASFEFQMTFSNFAAFDAAGPFAGLHGDISFDYTVDQPSGTIAYAISGQSIAGAEGLDRQIASAFLLAGTSGAASRYSETLVETYDSGFFYPADELAYGFSGRMCSTEMGGCLTVVIDPAFTQYPPDLYPDYGGTLLISADNGAFIEIFAVDGSTGEIEVTWDVDGAGAVATQGPFTTTWSCLETEVDSSACFP